MHFAGMCGHLDACNVLLAAGANVHAFTEGGSALHMAAAIGHVAVCEALVAAGANVHATAGIDRTPLSVCGDAAADLPI